MLQLSRDMWKYVLACPGLQATALFWSIPMGAVVRAIVRLRVVSAWLHPTTLLLVALSVQIPKDDQELRLQHLFAMPLSAIRSVFAEKAPLHLDRPGWILVQSVPQANISPPPEACCVVIAPADQFRQREVRCVHVCQLSEQNASACQDFLIQHPRRFSCNIPVQEYVLAVARDIL